MKEKQVPQSIVDILGVLRNLCDEHGYSLIASTFYPATDDTNSQCITAFRTNVCHFRIMVDFLVKNINDHRAKDGLDPIILDDDWLPFEQLAGGD